MSYLVEASEIYKEYYKSSSVISVLQGINLNVQKGEFIAIVGPSGSGKTTLLNIVGCLERPTSGSYMLSGMDVSKASDRELSGIRAQSIGFIFQTFNLIPQLNVYENMEVPFLYSSSNTVSSEEKVLKAIEWVGLGNRLKHRPSELSGGEMQRVAIARALAIRPSIILADEPTGNLDSKTGRDILRLFRNLHNEGSTILMITHDSEVASYAQRRITLRDGRII